MAQHCGALTYLGVSEGEAMGCRIVVPLLPVSQRGRLGRWGGGTYERSEIHNNEQQISSIVHHLVATLLSATWHLDSV